MRSAVLILALVACVPPLGAQLPSADSFRPLVAATDSGGRCEEMNPVVLHDGESGVLLRFGTQPESSRVVSVVWDSTGVLRRFGDVRGDLRGPPTAPAARGRRTSILIDFVAGRALLLNETGVRNEGSTMTSPAAAMSAAQLGPPRALLVRLHQECGAPSGDAP